MPGLDPGIHRIETAGESPPFYLRPAYRFAFARQAFQSTVWPIVEVPSDQFPERGGLWAIQDEDKQDRTTYPVVDVVLVAPMLVATPRVWTFQPPGLPEFKATMRDKHFLSALEHNSVRERLRIGIPMKIRLEVKETKEDGAWLVKRGGRSVIEVISPKVD